MTQTHHHRRSHTRSTTTPPNRTLTRDGARPRTSGQPTHAARSAIADHTAWDEATPDAVVSRPTARAVGQFLALAHATPRQPGQACGHDALVAAGGRAIRRGLHLAAGGTRLTDGQAAWLTVLLAYPPVRDLAWLRTDGHLHHFELWVDLTQRADAYFIPAPAALAGWAAWRAGYLDLAETALDVALNADPTYTMAHILAEPVRAGVSAEVLDDLRDLVPDIPGNTTGPV